MRIFAALGALLILASCSAAEPGAICYKTVRAPGGKNPRALAVVPCAPQQQSEAERPLDPAHGATLG